MRTFSTCRGCGGLLMTAIGEKPVNRPNRHDECVIARPTRRETISEQLNQAIDEHAKMGQMAAEHGMTPADEEVCDKLEQLIADLKLQLAQLDNQPPRLLEAAVQYARWGWPVFPIAKHTKRPALPSAHPEGDPLRGVCKGNCGRVGHGVLDATTDVDRLKRYWTKHPDHNIGLATGFLFDVIDIDMPKEEGDANGYDQLPGFLANDRLPDAHAVVVTPSGGMHLYIPAQEGKGNRAGIRPGVDYRGRGGYVVAPPSLTMQGRYIFTVSPSPEIKAS